MEVSLRDNNTGTIVHHASATPESRLVFGMHPWSVAITPEAKHWAPQFSTHPNLAASPGRLEVSAKTYVDGSDRVVRSFSDAGMTCLTSHLQAGEDAITAGGACADGNDVVVFDHDGIALPGEEPLTLTNVGAARTETVAGRSISLQTVTYRSQGLTISGIVCRPRDTGTTVVRRAVRFINHGGPTPTEEGITAATEERCRRWAGQGFVAAASAYRGESSPRFDVPGTRVMSDGGVEYCLGEVTDVLRFTKILAAQPFVDASRMAMWGHSHGGCIATRVAQLGGPLKAVVDVAGLADLGTCEPTCAAGTYAAPTGAGAAARWRAPVTFAKDLAARTRVHDPVAAADLKYLRIDAEVGGGGPVPPRQGCRFVRAVWPPPSTEPVTSWHLSGASAPFGIAPGAPAGCDTLDTTLTWSAAALPAATWPMHTYLVFRDAGHFDVDDAADPLVESFFANAVP